MNELQGVPPYQRVIIVEDQNKDYTKEKHIATLKAKHYVPTVMSAAEQQRIDIENAHRELMDKHEQMVRELQELRAFKAQSLTENQSGDKAETAAPIQPSPAAPPSTTRQSSRSTQPASTPQETAKTGGQ